MTGDRLQHHSDKINRRELLLGTAVGIAAGGSLVRAADSFPARPNILLFTLDDCDAASLGCFGCPLDRVTPNLDAVADSGVRFAKAYTSSPTCQPSRLSLMTGMRPWTIGAIGHTDPLPPSTPTLPAILREAGYYTAILNKQPNYVPRSAFRWDRDWNDTTGNYLSSDDWVRNDDGYWSCWRDPSGYHGGVAALVGEAKAAGKPFFLHVNAVDPHRPWPGSVDEVNYLRNPQIFQERANSKLRPFARAYSPMEVPVPGYLPDLPGVRVDVSQYYGALTNGDRCFGAVMRALREADVDSTTAIICLSDQGAAFPMSKQCLYHYGLNAGMIMSWPGFTARGAVIDTALVDIADVMPTVLDLLGLPLPARSDGASLLPLLREGRDTGRTHILGGYTYVRPGVQVYPSRTIIAGRYQYIFNGWHDVRWPGTDRKIVYGGNLDSLAGLAWLSMTQAAASNPAVAARVAHVRFRLREELYDIESDPHCLTNLASDPAMTSVMSNLRSLLENEMTVTRDPLLERFRGADSLPAEWMHVAAKRE